MVFSAISFSSRILTGIASFEAGCSAVRTLASRVMNGKPIFSDREVEKKLSASAIYGISAANLLPDTAFFWAFVGISDACALKEEEWHPLIFRKAAQAWRELQTHYATPLFWGAVEGVCRCFKISDTAPIQNAFRVLHKDLKTLQTIILDSAQPFTKYGVFFTLFTLAVYQLGSLYAPRCALITAIASQIIGNELFDLSQ